MLKSVKTIALTALAAMAVLVGCKEESNQEEAAAAAPVLRPAGETFTVGFDSDFPPYGYIENGEMKGFDLDLAREVAKRNGWKIVLKPINWDSKDMELNSGSIDCIWNGFTINGREDAYEWSDPYVDNSQVVMIRKDSKIQGFEGLAGKTVAVQTDTPVQKALSAGGEREALGKTFKQLVVTPNYNNAIMELEAGSVDAVALDIGVARTKMAAANGKFLLLEDNVITEQYGIGFKKGNTALRDQVQNTLRAMVADKTAEEISKKYFDGKNVIVLKP